MDHASTQIGLAKGYAEANPIVLQWGVAVWLLIDLILIASVYVGAWLIGEGILLAVPYGFAVTLGVLRLHAAVVNLITVSANI